MIFDAKMILICSALCAAGGAAAGARYLGYPMGKAAEEAKMKKGPDGEYFVLYQTSLRITAEREQARAEVTKINDANVKISAENKRIEDQDRVARAIAVSRSESAATQASLEASATRQKIEEGRNALAKLADTCIASGVPAGFVSVLNTAITAAADFNRESAVPGSPANPRPLIQSPATDVHDRPATVSLPVH